MLVFLDRDRLINDEIGGGQFVLASPHSKFWGTRPHRPPVIYAHGQNYPSLQKRNRGTPRFPMVPVY